MYPRDVKSFYLIGLEAKVPIGVFSVDVERGGDSDEFVIKAKAVEWGYSRLSTLRDFLAGENSGVVRVQVRTAYRAGLGQSLKFILRRLGFDIRWFKMVNADPTIVPLRASNDLEALRNIAYLHAVHNHVVVSVVSKRYPVLHSNATPIMHAILMKSNYNHNKHLIQQHVPKKIIEKLPKVVLT
jgi:glycine cleavage system regulatory protein